MNVIISGAGPNGLMLACELALAGVRPVVLEALPEPSAEPKANGLVGEVVRLIDHRGLYEALAGVPGPPRPNSGYFPYAGMYLDLGSLDESPLHVLPAPQQKIVRVLTERALELGVEIRRGHELVGLRQDSSSVTVQVDGPDGRYELQASYLVGADGARSAVRKLSGIDFGGITYDRRTLRMAHATVPADWVDPTTRGLKIPGYGLALPFIGTRTEHGGFSYAPLPDKPPTIATTEWDEPPTDEPMTMDELRASVRRVLGVDVPLGEPTGDGPHLMNRLTRGNTRIAARFRDGRVFLLGDAAHIYAHGGAGLNLGMQDAANLGWKLAAEINGTAPAGLLDTYDTERRIAAERMVVYAQATNALLGPGSDVTALRTLFGEMLGDAATVQRIADLLAGSDIRYDMGVDDPHPLVGRFAPAMDLVTPDGPVRLAEVARTARPLLVDFTGALARFQGPVDVITAEPVEGIPAAVLIRPDSYVAWASSSPDTDGLSAALERWFGLAVNHV
ncbi:FAD-dependent monooxygenase [Kutzneria kofuensis]|uniref:2-polyprenyl-6-methoxyphenol hydroxylase-like FAD-dependent oxidoreductase n=1 Tax=Kutzneria kofuensis TaxID=103725 RepID=A0A7W9KND8_9PSEU|nr:FAD-dependent monooxygenase [Kutzneria kofuensis]MBB5895755.1 2-polyprenyl-6-methoxyphenol hydroxylase-like FAD-dependent oxidoreductase [Kutzneria kofuensis]